MTGVGGRVLNPPAMECNHNHTVCTNLNSVSRASILEHRFSPEKVLGT